MATRFAPLIDAGTGLAREGAIEVSGPTTVVLNLSQPDISFIASMSDYPAAIMHASYDGGDPFAAIGTGPFVGVSMEPGVKCVVERNRAHAWWGTDVFGGPWLDRVEFLDYGTDPNTWADAARAGEVDLLYESVGSFIDDMDALGWTRTETVTGATTVIRGNQAFEKDGVAPYADARVRRALALAVDNAVCLELGYDNRGTVAANHHVSPVHPEYADIGPAPYDSAAAAALMDEAGMSDFVHDLITVDDETQRNTGDVVAAMLRDTGFKVERTILPGAFFWRDWAHHPFSCTEWNHRPLGVQILALAYRSGQAWNETAYANPDFDALMDEALSLADADRRREVMARIETLLREDGVMIQPYWRSLYNHHNGTLVNAEKHPAHEIQIHRIGFAA